MSRLDDRLTHELERAARPADPANVFERIDGRRARRHTVRRVRAGALAVVVIAGSIGGFAYLNQAFESTGTPGGTGETDVTRSPTPSTTPTIVAPVDLGLGFPVCDVRSMSRPTSTATARWTRRRSPRR